MQTIHGSISINASKHKVWQVLQDDKYTRQWYAEFSAGTYAITDWQVGSKAIFTDDSKSGLIGRILIGRPAEELVIEYEGLLTKGEEVYDSAEAKAVKGGKEKYILTGNDAQTLLTIECDMDKSYYEFMSKAWQKALQKIKELSESN